jgi:hypothetical protein
MGSAARNRRRPRHPREDEQERAVASGWMSRWIVDRRLRNRASHARYARRVHATWKHARSQAERAPSENRAPLTPAGARPANALPQPASPALARRQREPRGRSGGPLRPPRPRPRPASSGRPPCAAGVRRNHASPARPPSASRRRSRDPPRRRSGTPPPSTRGRPRAGAVAGASRDHQRAHRASANRPDARSAPRGRPEARVRRNSASGRHRADGHRRAVVRPIDRRRDREQVYEWGERFHRHVPISLSDRRRQTGQAMWKNFPRCPPAALANASARVGRPCGTSPSTSRTDRRTGRNRAPSRPGS